LITEPLIVLGIVIIIIQNENEVRGKPRGWDAPLIFSIFTSTHF